MPDSMIAVGWKLILRAIVKIIDTVKSPPKNAAAVMYPGLSVTMAMVAPHAAPLETPSIYGSARGFLSNDWNTQPDVANAHPVMNAIPTRSARSSIISLCMGMGFWKKVTRVILDGPMLKATATIPMARIINNMKKNLCKNPYVVF